MVVTVEEVPGNRGKLVHFGRDGEADVAGRGFWRGYGVLIVEEVPGICGKMMHFGSGLRGMEREVHVARKGLSRV